MPENMKELPSVTLIAVDCTNRINGTVEALKKCSNYFKFGSVKLITDKIIPIPEPIQLVPCLSIKNINEFNRFMFLELGKYISTSHCLYVQDHAYIINPQSWDDSWLKYDYIGAPWQISSVSYLANTGERVRVGNGGFSLRSSKLMNIPAKKGWELRHDRGYYNEDGNICCYWRKEYLEEGIQYAPLDVAVNFSFEGAIPENKGIKTFGFHRHMPS